MLAIQLTGKQILGTVLQISASLTGGVSLVRTVHNLQSRIVSVGVLVFVLVDSGIPQSK